MLTRCTYQSVIRLLFEGCLCDGALDASLPGDDATAVILGGPFLKAIAGGLAGHECWAWLGAWGRAMTAKTQ